MLRSYSSPYNLGHKALADLFSGQVYVQEKIDGSQFSFGVRDGRLVCRSRNQQIDLENPGMFDKAIETAKYFVSVNPCEGVTYRCEYLRKPKHNTLCYDRVPDRHLIIYDVDYGDQNYLLPPDIIVGAGLEVVPLLAVYDEAPSWDTLEALLNTKSVLGDVLIEGIVIKNYTQYGKNKKVLMGKLVSESFRERHNKDWKNRNPNQKGRLETIIQRYRTDARLHKAVQHLTEAGELEHSPRDIGKFMKELSSDFENSDVEDCKEMLWLAFRKDILKGITKGAPEWYKDLLEEKS